MALTSLARGAFRQLGVALDLMIRVGEHAELMIKAAKPRKPRVDDDDEDLPF